MGQSHDGRVFRYFDHNIKRHDTVKYDLEKGKIVGHESFAENKLAYVTAGNNCGRIGIITAIKKYDGSHNMITLKDERGSEFITRQENVFVIGK